MRKVTVTILISIMIILSLAVIAINVYAATEETPGYGHETIYKDWSNLKSMDTDYSYSTLFYTKDTKIKTIYKKKADVEYQEKDSIEIKLPEATVKPGGEVILLIEKCAIDKEGKKLDVVVKIKDVMLFNPKVADNPEYKNGYVHMRLDSTLFTEEQGNVANRDTTTEKPKIGSVLNFGLHASYAKCNFSMKYYEADSYEFIAPDENGKYKEKGTVANIEKINTFVYDIDAYPGNRDNWKDNFLHGNEGIIPTKGETTIYYNKNNKPYLQEIYDGIAINDYDKTYETNGIWHKTSVLMSTTKITDSGFSFDYGGVNCGLHYSFVSPYPYKIDGIKKAVTTQKKKSELGLKDTTLNGDQPVVKEGERFTYTISQYVPNNYYGSLINFSKIYDNLYKDTHFKSFQISDQLDENLEVCGDIIIKNEDGEDKTKLFDIKNVNNYITATVKDKVNPDDSKKILNKLTFYSHIYNVEIPVRIKKGTGKTLNKETTTISNKGKITYQIGEDKEIFNKKTNEVETGIYYHIKTSIDNGKITYKNKEDGQTIYIHEDDTIKFSANEGYYISSITINGEKQKIDNKYSGTIELTNVREDYEIVVKTKALAEIQITKKNAVTQNPVAGAIYTIYQDKECTSPVKGLENLKTTGTEGTVISPKIPAGTYYAKEIKAPDNYTLNEEVQTITVKAGETVQVTFLNEPYGDIQIIKKDSATGEGLSGVKINIYRDSNCQELIQTLTTGVGGKIKSKLIYPNTTYYVREEEGLANYVIDQTIHDVFVNPGVTSSIEILNEPYGQIQITKKNAITLQPVAGAVIGIYYDNNCTLPVEGLERLATEGTEGMVTSKKIPAGTYYAKELQAPINYTLNSTVQKVVVDPNETAQVTFINEPYGDIQVTKKDSNTKEVLQGAKIGVYRDIACRDLVQTLTTRADGTAKSRLIYPNTTYYIKEIEAPANYALNSTVQTLYVNPGQTSQVVVENQPNTAQVEIDKIDYQTGKIVTKESTTFAIYEWQANTNTWVAPTHINTTTTNGTASDGKGAILTEKEAGTKGTYTTTVYYNAQNQGKFRVVEYERPYGYTISNWTTEIQITRNGQIFAYHTEVRNHEVRGQINFKKNDAEVNYNNENYEENFAQGDATLQGAIYGVYAKEDIISPDDGSVLYQAGQQITTGTTDANGKITWTNLYLGKYNIQEVNPSTGYLKDDTKYEVDLQDYYYNQYFLKGDQTTSNIIYKNAVVDAKYNNPEQRVISQERIMKQSFQLTKLSLSEDSTMANPLQGAGFKIYFIKDLSKVKDGTIKADTNGNYNIADLKVIDFTKEQTALTFTNDINGERIPELFSDEKGILISPELAYGKYIIIESTVPDDVQIIEPFMVDIQEDSRTPKNMVYPVDRNFDARIKVVKKDDTTGRTVLKANASYRIKDTTNNQYVEQWVTYPNKVKYGTEHNPYKTTEEGYLLTPEVLNAGEYELIEVAAPEGYILAGKEENPKTNVKFVISSNTVYEVDPDLGSHGTIVTVEQQNTPQLGTITVSKKGEYLSHSQEHEGNYEFTYTQRVVTDAKFAIYAKEDIYTQDNQGQKIYEKDQFIREGETNEEGKVIFERLPLGKYYLKETKAGEGFVLNTEQKEVELTYQGQDKILVYEDSEYINERQKVNIKISKKDREKGTLLAGAEFGLYTKESIRYIDNNKNTQTIPENKLVGKATSGEEGIATFDNDNLPLGKYYIKELTAPEGYATNPQIIDLDCSYLGQNIDKVIKEIDFTNIMTKLKIKVIDYETEVSLANTQIALRDKNNHIIGTYTVDDKGEVEVRGLAVGSQYKIEEIKQRNGYVKDLLFTNETTDPNELVKGKNAEGFITFETKNIEETQKVTISNIAKVGQIEIEKTGEVLVGTRQDEKGNIVFNYETQRIDTATFEIYTKEDIIHPDGEQGVILPEGTKIGEGQTQNGILTITKCQEEIIQTKPEIVQALFNRGLPLGVYEIKETVAPKGYFYKEKEQIKTVRLVSHDDNNQIEKVEISINNPRQSTNVGKPNPGIAIEKRAEKHSYQQGEQVVYIIKVSNTGNTKIKDIEVKETLINGEFDETAGASKKDNNTIILDKLEQNEVKTLTYRYNIPEQTKGEIDNQVTAIGTPVKIVTTTEGEEREEDLEPIKDNDKEKVWVGTLIEKTADRKTYQPGKSINYTLNIMNPYDEAIENAVIKDEKIKQGSMISTSKEGVEITQDGVLSVGRIEERERIEIVYQYEIPKDYTESTLTNIAEMSGTINMEPMVPEKSSTTVEVKKSGIKITKEAEKECYQKGEIVNYTIKVTNMGSTQLKDIIVKETMIKGSFEEKTGIHRMDDQTVKIEQLEAGKSEILTYQYKVGDEIILGEKIPNKVTVTGKGIIENSNDPDHPTTEEVSDEAEEEIVVKEENVVNQKLGIYKTDAETGETIAGAIFGLYATEDIIGANNTVMIPKDTLIEKAKTNQEGYAKFTADLPIGKFYILEIKPATGYIENTQRLEVDSTEINSTEKEYKVRLEIQNKKTEINIEKVEKTEDLKQRIPIVGSKLQILDQEKNIIEEWTTDEKPYNKKGLETEKKYILHEVDVAKGYVMAEDIKFSINLDGTLNIEEAYTIEGTQIPTIIMQDDITRIKVKVIDKETKEPIQGVVVQMIDKKTGEVVYELITSEEEQIIEKVPIGDYEIVEKDYPRDQGYVSIDIEEFTVKDTPELQEKVIEQDFTKLDISFLDEITKKVLAGGKLEIRKEDGEVVATIDDTGVHTYLERLPVGDYTIVEIEIPEGYEPCKESKFTLEDMPEIQYVVIENKRLPFDFKVEKYTSGISINGVKQTQTQQLGQMLKIEIDGKKIPSQNVELEYTIKVINTGKVAGSVGEIIDKIPFGLTFNASKNETYWETKTGNRIITKALADKKIQPGESRDLKVILDWTKSEFNLGEKKNEVTIGNFTNNPGFEDENESNNHSEASILLSIKTGLEVVLTKQIVATILVALITIGIIATVEIKIMTRKNK